MKILRAADIKFVDDYTIAHEPISSVALVERVALALRKELQHCFPEQKRLAIVCGKGKNAADGMSLALLLAQDDSYKIRLLTCYPQQELCEEASYFYAKIKSCNSLKISELENKTLPHFQPDELIVDALFGTGLTRPLAGYQKQVVQKINASSNPVLSIDIPSGMMSEDNTKNDADAIVRARSTFALNAPKLAMLLPDTGSFAGRLHVLNIGLHPNALAQAASHMYYFTPDDARQIFKPREKFSHKGNYGHCLLVAGSRGMMGAAVLASRACLHSGVGLLTTHVPKCGVEILQTAVPEAMLSIDNSSSYFSGVDDFDCKKYSSIAVGCGISCDEVTSEAFETFLHQAHTTPLVLDADALNIIAQNKTLLNFLPESTIITPHPKEFERLAGASSSAFERLQRQQDFARQYKIIVVVKGMHTATALPSGEVFFNSTGNPGMATAGSGDVLTGVIAALLAQGYTAAQAALLGVLIHGMAGDAAAAKTSQGFITANNIVENLYEFEVDYFHTTSNHLKQFLNY